MTKYLYFKINNLCRAISKRVIIIKVRNIRKINNIGFISLPVTAWILYFNDSIIASPKSAITR